MKKKFTLKCECENTNKMRIFILANGNATRWNNAYNTDKQLLEIDGEPLIYRTVRLLKENGFDDIYIIGKYKIEGAKNYIPNFESLIGKFDITKELWNDIDSFALLYGDCYYTEAIINDLATRKTDKKWLHWCCNRPNKVTGKIWEEGYIHTVYDIDFWRTQCDNFHRDFDNTDIEYKNDWVFLRYMLGLDLFVHQPELMKENEIDWEDETDDFDFPIDYYNWLKNCRNTEIEKWGE